MTVTENIIAARKPEILHKPSMFFFGFLLFLLFLREHAPVPPTIMIFWSPICMFGSFSLEFGPRCSVVRPPPSEYRILLNNYDNC